MSETMKGLDTETIEPQVTAGQSLGSVAVHEGLDERQKAILEKLQRDNSDAAM
ncbi:MAG: hypothetical protein Q7R60_04090 [bacterium]|nr:hypothetical protein [bacterium]